MAITAEQIKAEIAQLDERIAQASPRRRPLTRKRIGICSRCLTDSKAVGPADHFAHRAFGDGFHRAFGLLHVEEEIADVVRLDLPQH